MKLRTEQMGGTGKLRYISMNRVLLQNHFNRSKKEHQQTSVPFHTIAVCCISAQTACKFPSLQHASNDGSMKENNVTI